MNSLKWKERKGEKEGGRGNERERRGIERERDRWGSEWVRERGRLLKRERERERGVRERKTDVPKLYAYNECEQFVGRCHRAK